LALQPTVEYISTSRLTKPLGVHFDADGYIPRWESLADFWREAETLADLWDKFRQVTQRDLDGMREWIRFVSLSKEIKYLLGEVEHSI
jgi:hypothetical protein